MWQRNGKNGIVLYLGTKAVTSSFWTKAAVIPIWQDSMLMLLADVEQRIQLHCASQRIQRSFPRFSRMEVTIILLFLEEQLLPVSKNILRRIFCRIWAALPFSSWIIWNLTMRKQWKSYWTTLESIIFICRRIARISIPLKSSGQRSRRSFANARLEQSIPFPMQFRQPFVWFPTVTVSVGSVRAAIRFNSENCYNRRIV